MVTGVGVDIALIRSFGVAFAVWIAVGFVNRVLRDAQTAVEADKPKPVEAPKGDGKKQSPAAAAAARGVLQGDGTRSAMDRFGGQANPQAAQIMSALDRQRLAQELAKTR